MNPRYLNPDPLVQQRLDLLKLPVGFDSQFARGVAHMPAEPATSLTKAGHVLRDAVGRLERLANDPTKLSPVKHQDARRLYERMSHDMKESAKSAARWADREMHSARDNMAAVLSKDSSKASLYSEIRAWCASRKSDPNFPAELARLVESDIDVAVAISTAPAFLSGVSDERKSTLTKSAMLAFSPEDAERLMVAQTVAVEAERCDKAVDGLRPAFYAEGIAQLANAAVDVSADWVMPTSPAE
ncbi:hypothetical protein [Paracoccus nototheniae]|uniref:Uncharacterized protein n=1 Tax=Paracoccus nototheniae TaxID=2489002 RepID=A0ABW4E090_9RHOB|nr:hypothetical protein [Paracoccus nototheniae]